MTACPNCRSTRLEHNPGPRYSWSCLDCGCEFHTHPEVKVIKLGRPMVDPQTDVQWQEAVDAAHALLLVESARAYGLLVGGPTAHVDRCREILERGLALGIKPSATALEDLLDQIA